MRARDYSALSFLTDAAIHRTPAKSPSPGDQGRVGATDLGVHEHVFARRRRLRLSQSRLPFEPKHARSALSRDVVRSFRSILGSRRPALTRLFLRRSALVRPRLFCSSPAPPRLFSRHTPCAQPARHEFRLFRLGSLDVLTLRLFSRLPSLLRIRLYLWHLLASVLKAQQRQATPHSPTHSQCRPSPSSSLFPPRSSAFGRIPPPLTAPTSSRHQPPRIRNRLAPSSAHTLSLDLRQPSYSSAS